MPYPSQFLTFHFNWEKFVSSNTNCTVFGNPSACHKFYTCTWFSGELGREAQDEFEDDGERGSSLMQTPVEWQMRF